MKISVPTWSFPALTRAETAAFARATGFDGIAVGLLYESALDKVAILANPEAVAEEVLSDGLAIADYYHIFGEDLADRAISDASAFDQNVADLDAVIRFCAAAKIPTAMLLPGVLAPGQSVDNAFETSANFLRHAVAAGHARGVQITVEPHVHSIIETPVAVLRLLDAVPGLKLALDHSHFVCLGYTQEAVEPLLPHAAHIHLRQARAGRLQERLPHGTINFRQLLSQLVELGYDGWLTPEPLHQEYIDSWNVDVVSEVIGLRDLIRNHTAGLQ